LDAIERAARELADVERGGCVSELAYTTLVDGLRALHAAIEGTRVLGAEHAAVQAKCLAAATMLSRASEGLRLRRDSAGLIHVVSFDGRVACGGVPLPTAAPLASTLFASFATVGGPALSIASKVEASDVEQMAKAVMMRDGGLVPAGHALRACRVVSQLAQTGKAPQAPTVDPARAGSTLQTAWESVRTGSHIPMHAVDSLAEQMHAMLRGDASAMLHLSALKTHDQYTFVHTVNVSLLSASLAQACGLSDAMVHDIAVGAMLHDVGKGLVPEHILNKKGKLEGNELAVMRRHPLDGARMLIDAGNAPDLAVVIAYEHHMHLNRTGYPLPRQDHFPHLASQIVQVADMYDALRTNRPYRAGMPIEKAQEIMLAGAGVSHDKALLDWFFERIALRCADERDVAGESPEAATEASDAPNTPAATTAP
jgi:HD-GYP domain-containing protein (c-di-GMP phosphodiesterase class II)